MTAEAVGARDSDLGEAFVATYGVNDSGQDEGVVGVCGHPEPDRQPPEYGVGAEAVGEVAADEALGGEDVHEDVRRSLGAGRLGVVVDVREVAGDQGARDDQGAGHRDGEGGELITGLHVFTPARKTGSSCSSAGPYARTNSSSTGMPMRIRSGAIPVTLLIIRTPSASSISPTA